MHELDAPPGADACTKQYDQSYFDRWYQRSSVGVGRQEFVARKVRLAVTTAEYLLGRPIRNVLDVGCGEAPWRAVLKRMRPKVRYQGLDTSDYVVARFGKRRNIAKGGLGDLDFIQLDGPFDLVVCADVLHYVRTPEVRLGLRALTPLVHGVAFIEVFSAGDEIEGDRAEFQERTAAVYERFFADAGLTRIGPHLYVGRGMLDTLVDFEGRRGTSRG